MVLKVRKVILLGGGEKGMVGRGPWGLCKGDNVLFLTGCWLHGCINFVKTHPAVYLGFVHF